VEWAFSEVRRYGVLRSSSPLAPQNSKDGPIELVINTAIA
jgi:hypothetical protein